jgi:hypothetical protein
MKLTENLKIESYLRIQIYNFNEDLTQYAVENVPRCMLCLYRPAKQEIITQFNPLVSIPICTECLSLLSKMIQEALDADKPTISELEDRMCR